MIILDTNVISALMLNDPAKIIQTWMDRQSLQDLYIAAISVFELVYGIERLPIGKRRTQLAERLQIVISQAFADRILEFDAEAAEQAGKFRALHKNAGHHDDILDIQIAAIASTNNATLATRNTRDFEHFPIRVVNPWNA
jgi:predicted nucleic acid-binding protein